MARHKRGKSYIHESNESIRRQEVQRLRLMSAEAARRGDRAEASKLDALADEAAQMPLVAQKPKVKKPVQLKLPIEVGE